MRKKSCERDGRSCGEYVKNWRNAVSGMESFWVTVEWMKIFDGFFFVLSRVKEV